MRKHSIRLKGKIKLLKSDCEKINNILSARTGAVRVIKRSQILVALSKGYSSPTIADFLSINPVTVRSVGKRFLSGGIEKALYECSRPGKKPIVSDSDENRIIAMVCSNPPEGYDRWSIRLIAEEALKRRIVTKVGREKIRVILENHDLKPWLKKNVVHR